MLYNFDLELPADFVPVNADGEVEEFYLWPVEQVMDMVRDGDEFKFNCSLVVIDFLIRHGFIPPEHALDPLGYYAARIASKIARYSKYSNQFVLATPPVSILPIPSLFRRPPRDRRPSEIRDVKQLCDRYYLNPPVTEDEILNARLHMIYIINIDAGKVVEMDVESYLDQFAGMLSPGSLEL